MRKRALMAIGVVTACLLTPLAHAEQWHTARIKHLYPTADGNFVLIFETNSTHCPSTANPHYYNVHMGSNSVTAEGSKKLFATAALAFAMGKPVSIAFDESTQSCFVNRLLVAD